MRYIIAVIVGLTILAFSSSVLADDHTWQRPTECADEDRQVSGNRSTPCKYVMPVLEKVEYEVRMNYPECWELLIFHMPGAKPLPDDFPLYTDIRTFRSKNNDRDANTFDLTGSIGTASSDHLLFRIDKIGYIGYGWGLGDTVYRSAFPKPSTYYPYVRIAIIHEVPWSNGVLYPDTTNTVELVNACLALVVQEKANREHAAEIERQEQAEAARLKAERDAAAKEEEQARLTAESQARIAEQQLAAANERRLAIARAEEIKTQTLIDEIATQEVLTEILNDIVRIRVLCLPINRKQYGSHGRSIWIRPGANRCQQVAGPPSLYAHTAAPAVSVPTYAVTPRHFLVVAKRASALDSYKCHSNLVPASRHIESLICYGERLHQFWRVGLLP